MYTSGRLPDAADRASTRACPTVGTGQYEWQGFLPEGQHIHRASIPADGTMVNWNNISAHGFGAADDSWGGNGSVARVDMLNRNLKRLEDERQVVARDGHLGDERRGDPGRARDRHGPAADAAAEGHEGPERAGARRCCSC